MNVSRLRGIPRNLMDWVREGLLAWRAHQGLVLFCKSRPDLSQEARVTLFHLGENLRQQKTLAVALAACLLCVPGPIFLFCQKGASTIPLLCLASLALACASLVFSLTSHRRMAALLRAGFESHSGIFREEIEAVALRASLEKALPVPAQATPAKKRL